MLTIRLLGDLALRRGDEPVALPPSRKTRALLGYLVATGRPQRRERLCSLLWELPDDPRGALRWSLSKLRGLLDDPGGATRVLADRDSVAFTAAGAVSDLDGLRGLAGSALTAASTEQLLAVAEGIGGAFLEGLELPAQPEFQAWCLAEREDARRRHAAVLRALVERLAAGAVEEALPHARRLVGLDGFDGRARASLVALLARAGRREEAEQQCEAGLRQLHEAGMAEGDLARAARELRSALPLRRGAAPEPDRAPTALGPGAPAPSAAAVPDGGSRDAARLVIVDDEPELARMVAEYLERHGFAVRTAGSGGELDALLSAEPADLLILDVTMPGEDGFTIARRLRAAGGPPVLFLSAVSAVADRVVGLELGAVDYLTKPFDLRELRARVRAALRRDAVPGLPSRAVEEASDGAGAGQAEERPVPDAAPSIAVLPFRIAGDDPGQHLLADGLAEELITALSRIRSFFVVGRNSSFAYKGRLVPVSQVGRELRARYVVEGSVQRAGERVRVTAQLVETEAGSPVWADRFDGGLDDVFGLQDRVVARILGAVEPNLRRAEVSRLGRRRPTEAPRAYEAYLRAIALMHPMTEANCTTALDMLGQALAQDPGFGLALSAAAWCRLWRIVQEFGGRVDSTEGGRAIALAEAAVTAAPDDPTVLARAAMVFCYLPHRRPAAAAYAERAVELHPNSALARTVAGWVELDAERPDKALAQFAAALRLDPLDPSAGEPVAGTAFAHLLAGSVETAVEWGERAVAASPNGMAAHRALVAAVGLAGRPAGAAVARLLALAPGYTVARYAGQRSGLADRRLFGLVREGLLRAGVPEGA